MGQTRSMWGVLCMNSHVSSCNMLMSSTTCTVLFLFSSVGYGCLSVGHCAFWVFSDMTCVFVFPRFEEDREQRHFEEQMKQIVQMESITPVAGLIFETKNRAIFRRDFSGEKLLPENSFLGQ